MSSKGHLLSLKWSLLEPLPNPFTRLKFSLGRTKSYKNPRILHGQAHINCVYVQLEMSSSINVFGSPVILEAIEHFRYAT